jgi:hypothetical protein
VSPRRITIFERTRRDGEQSPGIAAWYKELADARTAVTVYDVFEEVPAR